jgi:hypothetical protein
MGEENKLEIEDQEEGWDPANVAATIVLVIVGIGLLFFLFWSLMVLKSVTGNIIAGLILLILIGEVIYVFKK